MIEGVFRDRPAFHRCRGDGVFWFDRDELEAVLARAVGLLGT